MNAFNFFTQLPVLLSTMAFRTLYPRLVTAYTQQWMADFVHWYNTEHLHSSIGYVTPHQMRYGQAEAIFEQQNDAINRAREPHPERWGSRPAKKWIVNREMVLNPDKK